MSPKPKEMSLTIEEIEHIITISRKNDVSKLVFRELEVQFHRPVEQLDEVSQKSSPVGFANSQSPSAGAISDELKRIEQQNLEDAEFKLRDDQIDQMLIEDPAKAEEMLLNGDFEDESDDDGDAE
jgi:hypothetical protein